MTQKVTSPQITELLRNKHAGNDWACFSELASGTGAKSGGFIDFFAFNIWPSNRYRKIAYEIKVSRSDFARELQNPRKREYAERFADECYFAIPSGLVKADEVPEGWGLIEVTKGGLKTTKMALQRTPEPLPIQFVAAIARRVKDDPSPLPSAIWLLEGQEVSGTNALIECASEALVRQIRRDAELKIADADHRAIQKLKRQTDISCVVQRKLGHWVTPEEVEQWIDKRMLAGSGLSPQLIAELAELRDKIEKVVTANYEHQKNSQNLEVS